MADRKINRPIRDVAPAAKPPKKKLDLDALLTPEIKAKLRAEAEETVRKREMIEAEAEYLAQQTAEIEKRNHPEIVEEMREINLYLPPHLDCIILDGYHYMRGGTYKVRKSVYDVMREVIQAGFRHDDEINGRLAEQRKERNLYVSGRTGQVTDPNGRPVAF